LITRPIFLTTPNASIIGNLPLVGNLNSQRFRVSNVMGMQANGVAVVSDLIVRTSILTASILLYHLRYSQLVNHPLNNDGYMRASMAVGASNMITLNPKPETSVLNTDKSGVMLRINIEPDWENNPCCAPCTTEWSILHILQPAYSCQ